MSLEKQRAVLEARKTWEESTTTWDGTLDRNVAWKKLVRATDGLVACDIDPALRPAWDAWVDEVSEENARRQQAALDAAMAARAAVIEHRRGLTLEALRAEVSDIPDDVMAILGGDGAVTELAASSHGPVETRVLVRWPNPSTTGGTPRVSRIAHLGGKDYDSVTYWIEDGVITIPGSSWAARVRDPAAPKPDYAFLDRCPGGYVLPALAAGDVLVWGSKDKKGRKEGPFDRLVYAVGEDRVRTIRCDYITARRLRKLLKA